MQEKTLRRRISQTQDPAKDVKDPNGVPSVSVKTEVAHTEPGKALSKTLTWLEIPDWQKDNEYILTGYRSAFYHTFSMHSEAVAGRCNALDYAGIVVLTVGSFFPPMYYGFFCEPHYQAIYLTCITAAGLVSAYIVINPEYRKPTHRGARTKVFIFLGLSGVLPIIHGLITHGFYTLCYEMGFGWLVVCGALYISGALLYANRIPERFSPGTFDYFFSSHQIFHFFVVAAALATYAGVLTAFHHTHRRLGECPAR
ncbi:hypothetical protein BN946_scf184569.g31 [Trametes cinnabarina]|uniref:HlyIII-domain-containing protein n=1 Tax=Pycnoporus cinnabarinus TaxID=5643 RepID=A0A060SDK9_PYCCI|nr:hypothetical protein BN946_scf184569.g31 [Trametes cinnabarina]